MASEEKKIGYAEIEVGSEFPPTSFTLDEKLVETYLTATDDRSSKVSYETNIAPPAAIAAWALASLLEIFELPFGTIHLSQQFEVKGTARTGDTLTCKASVSRKQDRGKLKLLSIDISVVDQSKRLVLVGKSAFNLP